MKKVKLLAFISAVITALLLYAYLNSLGQTAQTIKNKAVTAAVDIPANTPITAEMLTLAELPAEAVVKGVLTETAPVIGRVCESKIFAGEQILGSKLISAGDKGSKTLAYAIKPGMRAITIAVDITTGLSNMLAPGNHIDLIADFLDENGTAADAAKSGSSAPPSSGNEKISYSTMLAENLTVLAVDNVLTEDGKLKAEEPAYATLTLQVTPQQALDLSMAQFEGQLRAILRSPLDEKKTNLPSITLDDVMIK